MLPEAAASDAADATDVVLSAPSNIATQPAAVLFIGFRSHITTKTITELLDETSNLPSAAAVAIAPSTTAVATTAGDDFAPTHHQTILFTFTTDDSSPTTTAVAATTIGAVATMTADDSVPSTGAAATTADESVPTTTAAVTTADDSMPATIPADDSAPATTVAATSSEDSSPTTTAAATTNDSDPTNASAATTIDDESVAATSAAATSAATSAADDSVPTTTAPATTAGETVPISSAIASTTAGESAPPASAVTSTAVDDSVQHISAVVNTSAITVSPATGTPPAPAISAASISQATSISAFSSVTTVAYTPIVMAIASVSATEPVVSTTSAAVPGKSLFATETTPTTVVAPSHTPAVATKLAAATSIVCLPPCPSAAAAAESEAASAAVPPLTSVEAVTEPEVTSSDAIETQKFPLSKDIDTSKPPLVSEAATKGGNIMKHQAKPSQTERDVVLRSLPSAASAAKGAPQSTVTPKATARFSLQDLKIYACIGRGAFSPVFAVEFRRQRGVRYALKALRKMDVSNSNQQHLVLREVQLLKELDSPFIIKLHGTSQDRHNLYVLMELVGGGDLFSYIKSRTEFGDWYYAKFYASEVVVGLQYLHSKGIIFRDLKPDNILLDAAGHVKLCDLGFAKRLEGSRNTFCGTPDYMALEIVMDRPYGKQADWWSLGCLVFELVSGRRPFHGKDPEETYSNIRHGRILRDDQRIRGPCKDLIMRLLERDPFK
ncbi:hypothetical protein HDU98_003581, partial [Podochytrium sp. JEL0797]